MPFNLLLFPLAAGYCFIHIFYYTRYRAYDLDGYRLLIESVLAGFALSPCAALAAAGARIWLPSLSSFWKGLAPFDHSGKAAALIILSVLLASGLNLVLLLRPGRQAVVSQVLRSYGDPLTRLFLSAVERSQQILVTMKDGKVYVGWVIISLGLNPKTRHVRLLPSLSGYRERDSRKTVFTTNYGHIYDRITTGGDAVLERFTAKDFQVVLPLENIESARLFDFEVYQRHFADRMVDA